MRLLRLALVPVCLGLGCGGEEPPISESIPLEPRAEIASKSLSLSRGGSPSRVHLERQATRELHNLRSRVAAFRIVKIPRWGICRLGPRESITIEDLRGVGIDDHPTSIGTAPPPSDAMSVGTGGWPFRANGIQPFRFRYYGVEFNYVGDHNWEMTDYAATHGFNIFHLENRAPPDAFYYPHKSKWLFNFTGHFWRNWMQQRGVPEGRYDLLPPHSVLVEELRIQGHFSYRPEFHVAMLDLEHPVLSPESLREQAWYPRDATDAERTALENRYYEGFIDTHLASVQCARLQGWPEIGIYGVQPFAKTWWGLESVGDPSLLWQWQRYAQAIMADVDVIYPSVYSPYWSDRHVAYTLANIDLNLRLVGPWSARAKPVRPYFWPRMHPGGSGWRWWRQLPLPNEEMRAIVAMSFFTGMDGLVLWDASGRANNHQPSVAANQDVLVAAPFKAPAENSSLGRAFARYDALHILEITPSDLVRFQFILKEQPSVNYGVRGDFPVYSMPRVDLLSYLRPNSESVSAFIEGLALVRPFEFCLRHGEVKIDVSAQLQFRDRLPVLRRIKIGRYHLVITYDPLAVGRGKERAVDIPNFDGRSGLDLQFWADAQTRVYVLEED